MSRTNAIKLGQLASRAIQRRGVATAALTRTSIPIRAHQALRNGPRTAQFFSTSSQLAKPVDPEALKNAAAANLSDSQYHELADEYLEALLSKFEAEQDKTGEIDVEYSVSPPDPYLPALHLCCH